MKRTMFFYFILSPNTVIVAYITPECKNANMPNTGGIYALKGVRSSE